MKRFRCVTWVVCNDKGSRRAELHEEHEPEETHDGTPLLEFRTEIDGPTWKGNVCKRCRAIYALKDDK